MQRPIRSVAVLGSGVMGSAIAAHFANTGVPSLVLDIVPPKLDPAEEKRGLTRDDRVVRDRFARDNVGRLAKTRPSPLFSRARLDLIQVGNLEDDLAKLADVDWVIEVVREDLAIKRDLFERIAGHLAEGAIVSSNTSGLSLHAMAESLPESLRSRFLGTHFFNPPRYMKLLELIPTRWTDPGLLAAVAEFATVRLGKGIVHAKDTPNFVANRIGVHGLMVALDLLESSELSIEAIDAVTGPLIGRPKTATFPLADLVGLDTLGFVADTVRRAGDESASGFEPSPLLARLVEAGRLGRKAGAGFYRKQKKNPLEVVDPESLEYREPQPPPWPELRELSRIPDTRERLRSLVGADGPAASAAWRALAPTLSYSAMRLGEIADDAATIDKAMQLGFNWELGPFEAWDVLGFRPTVERMRRDGLPLPAWVDALYDGGAETLYTVDDGTPCAPTAEAGVRRPAPPDPRAVNLTLIRDGGGEVRRNRSASLLDLGDGVLGLEFHAKMNAVDDEMVEMMLAAADEAEASWRGIVVANHGENFCAGANLKLLVEHAEAGRFEPIEKIVRTFQRATLRLERCTVPVVMAPHGLALGGGAEVVLAGNAVQASAESYIGLVEVGAGVIPAGGGCMRLYRRHVEASGDPYAAVKATFETIGMAKVSTSAEEARDLGFLGPQDGWSMQGDFRIADAKAKVLAMASSGWTPRPERPLPVLGRSGVALVDSGLINMLEGRYISEHDRLIGHELALILAGGEIAGPAKVAPTHLLELELESFLRLCGEAKSRERMVALLKTGKPLRN